jgi:hypothetical protein
VNLPTELRQAARWLATLANVAAALQQPNLFHRDEKRRAHFLADELVELAHKLQAMQQTIESPPLIEVREKE